MELRPAAICFIVKDNRILLMQAKWAGNRWSVIGGKVEPGETPDAAVRREVAEETGLTLTEYRAAGQYILTEEDGRSGTLVHLFTATEFTGDLRGSEEGEPVWHELPLAGDLPVIPLVRSLLPRVLTPGAYINERIDTLAGP